MSRKLKRFIACALVLAMCMSLLTGCKKNESGLNGPDNSSETSGNVTGNETGNASGQETEVNAEPATPTPEPYHAQMDPTDDNYRVFYQIFVGSFSDSDGDGTGDIRGIINRLDYLNDGDINSGESLGVQGIWLSPIFSSPSYHKYDASNYYQVDEKFGTEEDLKELLTLCHERNVKVILDLAINHSSSSNAWFMKFCDAVKNGYTDSEWYDFYVHVTKEERIPGHTYINISGTSEAYECNFSSDMPELNFDNERVREECVNIAKYWLDLGVDGFRFDAIKYIYYQDTQKSADFWSWYMDELKAIKPDIYCIGECWSADTEVLNYIPALNCFNFTASQAEGIIAMTAKSGKVSNFTNYIVSYQNKLKEANPEAMMNLFISNHDMDRSAGYLMLANHFTQMGANLYLLAPGSPFIYYGEEIAAKGTRGGANTDANRRLAMNWGDKDTVKDPTGATYEYKKQTNGTVAQQLTKAESPLNHYKKVIALRIKYPEIPRGTYSQVVSDINQFGGFEIEYQGEKTVLLHNCSDSTVEIDLSELSGITATLSGVADYVGIETAELNGTKLTVGAQTSVILK